MLGNYKKLVHEIKIKVVMLFFVPRSKSDPNLTIFLGTQYISSPKSINHWL